MILPNKHTEFSRSLIGLGAIVIEQLDQPKTFDEIWNGVLCTYTLRDYTPMNQVDTLTASLVMLYSLGIIDQHAGMIRLSTDSQSQKGEVTCDF